MAKMIAQPEIVEFLDFLLLEHSNDSQLSEVILNGLDGTLKIGDIKKELLTQLNIVGMKKADGNYIVNPGAAVELNENDHLFVLGNPDDIKVFKQSIKNRTF
jgi:voltage-gated potassium channel